MKMKLVTNNKQEELCVQFIPENDAEKEILDCCVDGERLKWYTDAFTIGTGFKRK